ncbi:MAG: hypothetical protein ACXWQ5_00325 [Ktedonobacterales bacterium]
MDQQDIMRIARANIAAQREEPGAVTVLVTVVPTDSPTMQRWIVDANMDSGQQGFIAACGVSLAQRDKGEPAATFTGESQDAFMRLHEATTAFMEAVRAYAKVINTPA